MNNKEQLQKNLAVTYEVDGQQIKLTPQIVQDYIVGTGAQITIPEFKMFTELCKVRGLNPFLREAYCIKYSNKTPATIVVGKDAILKRAVLNPKYNGMKSGIIVTNENGEEKKRTGTFKLPTETLVGGWAEVFRKDWENSIEASVSLEEAIQRKSDGEPNSNWTDEMNVDLPEIRDEDKVILQGDQNIPEAEIKDDSNIKQVDINEL